MTKIKSNTKVSLKHIHRVNKKEDDQFIDLERDLEELNNDLFGINDVMSSTDDIDINEMPSFLKNLGNSKLDSKQFKEIGKEINNEIAININHLADDILDNTDETVQSLEENGFLLSIKKYFTTSFYLNKFYTIGHTILSFILPGSFKGNLNLSLDDEKNIAEIDLNHSKSILIDKNEHMLVGSHEVNENIAQ